MPTTSRRTPRRARTRVPLAVLVAGLLLPALVACGSGSGSDDDEPAAVATPTGSPFSVDVQGPDTATPGESVTVTLTNTGRLPDAYRLQPDPFAAVTIPEPEVRLGPGKSADIAVSVVSVPVIIRVESISAGQGGNAAVLSIGAVGG